MESLRIIFMGTPEFAVPSLEILIEHNYPIVAVITAPDKPKGRGRKTISSPVKLCALKNGIPVLQPTNLKSEEFLKELKSYQANLQVVVAFRMLPEVVWKMPSKGTFNLHASLLPKYRGAAPIHWAIINGEKETGLTTFFLKHQIDTGNIIWQQKETIDETDTTGTLSARLMVKGAQLVLKTVKSIEDDSFTLTSQQLEETQPKAPKLFKEDCRIDWSRRASEIVNFIRGLNPYPTAWTEINQVVYKIYLAETIQSYDPNLKLGDYQTDGKTYLHFRAKDASVAITELQAPGKRKMQIQEFLRGNEL